MKHEWVWDIKKQCAKAEVLFFFKQWGRPEFNENQEDPTINTEHEHHAKGGSMLNGKIYREMPDKYVPAYA